MDEIAKPKDIGEISREVCSMTTVEWKIPDFFSLPKEVDYCIKSSDFPFLGAIWNLSLFPNGEKEHSSGGWIGLYLIKKNSVQKQHHITYCLGMKKDDGTEYKKFADEDCFDNCGWGTCALVKRSEVLLNRRQIESKAAVKFFCTFYAKVTENRIATTQTTNCRDLEIPLQNLKELLDEEDGDIVLKVKDKEFKARKAILKLQSPVFRSMFTHGMKENENNFIDITDCDPIAFEDFLYFVYCGIVEEYCLDKMFGLYFVADKYDVTELKTICAEYIIDNISVNTFFDILKLALKYSDLMVLKHATDFFIENSVKVVETAQWLPFHKENPVASCELFLKAQQNNIPKQ